MQKYFNNVQDTFGNAISSVTVTIRTNPGGSIASIFSDNSGTVKANPFTNDADGEFFFYAADGRYDVELTGPITETNVDVRLLDIITGSSSIRINADINTATPPVAEAVTAQLLYYDLANNDLLADIGFLGSNALVINNRMHGGVFAIAAEDAAGTLRTILNSDPDTVTILRGDTQIQLQVGGTGETALLATPNGSVGLYHDNIKAFETHTRGIHLFSTLSSAPWMGWFNNSAVQQGFIQFGPTTSTIESEVHGANVVIIAEDAGGVNRTILDGDPDAATILRGDTDLRIDVAAGETAIYCTANSGVALYYNNIRRFDADTSGAIGIRSDGNTDIEARLLHFKHQNNALRAWMGHNADSNFAIHNNIHGGKFIVSTEDSGGVVRTILDGDPDANTILIADTDLYLKTGGTSWALKAWLNAQVGLYYNSVLALQTADHTAAGQISSAQVLDGNGTLRPVGIGVNDNFSLAGTGTQTYFNNVRAQHTIYWTGASATNMDTYASTGGSQTDLPTGAWWAVQNNGAGTLTLRGGTGVTIRYWSGAGAAPADVDVVVPRGAIALVRKISNTVYDFSHNG